MLDSFRWKPNTTVAAIIEKNGVFLMVEKETIQGMQFNQPAGHIEEGENLIDAVIREVWEETGYKFLPQRLVGIYLSEPNLFDIAYLRFAF